MTEHEQNQQDFAEFELADEAQIVQEMAGRISDTYVYEMKGVKDKDGKPTYGLSYSGTNWACREFARQGEIIRIVDTKDMSTPDEPEYYKIGVTAQRFSVDKETGKETALDSTTAGKKQWKFMTKRVWKDNQPAGEQKVPDPFAWEKCLSKAQRNAKQALIPGDLVNKLIAESVKSKSGIGKPAKPPATQKSSAAPASTTPAPTQPQAQAKPLSAPSSGTAPAQTQKPAASAPAAPAGTSAPPKLDRAIMIQNLDAISKKVFAVQDAAQARAKLAQLTGKASPSDLTDDEIRAVGNAIHAVSKKQAMIQGNNVIRTTDKAVLWKGPEVAAPPEAPAEAAPVEDDAPMF